MRIQAVEIRGFRSIGSTGLTNCGGLNVLIGKNNAGKSNLLAAIEAVMAHLRSETVSVPWPSERVRDDFTDRNVDQTIRIGVQFDLPSEINQNLRERLIKEAPNLERSIEQISSKSSLTFVVAGAREQGSFIRFVEQISVGTLESRGPDLDAGGIKLLSVARAAAYDLSRSTLLIRGFQADAKYLDTMISDRTRFEYYFREEGNSPEFLYLGTPTRPRSGLSRQIDAIAASVKNVDDFIRGLAALRQTIRTSVETEQDKEIEHSMFAFAGDVKRIPD